MKITKAYQFRLYPTKEQEILIHKTFGCTRFLYNQMLEEKKKDKTLRKFDLFKKIPEYIKNYPFLSEVDSCSLRNSITDLMIGFERYYKKLGGYRNLEQGPGRILNATIKQVGYKYYVSVCVEEELEIPVMSEKRAIGIDVGVKNMVVTSDGEYYENPDFLKKYERRIKGYQQELSRRKKGSKNYNKTLRKLEEFYRKLKNARKKYLEEVVSKILKGKEIILAED